MLWEMDGYAIEIIPSEKPEVRVIHWTENRKVLAVRADIPQQELRYIVREIIQNGKSDLSPDVLTTLDVFDKKWPLKILRGTGASYVKEGIIYCRSNNNPLSALQLQKVKDTLFFDYLYHCVGRWEELFDVLVPDVVVRKMNTKPFSVARANAKVTFSRSLQQSSQDLIAYVVFRAMADYVKLPLAQQEKLADRHFPLWKAYYKTLCYEYPRYL